VQRSRGLHHRPESAARRRAVSGAPLRLPDEIARQIADPRAYADWDRLHETLARVRREWPFARADLPDYPPFWVASRLADIREVASRNTEFLSGQGGLLSHDQLASERRRGAGQLFRSIVVMNEPEHAKYRALTQSWFQRAPLRRFEAKIRDLARRSVARIGELGSEFDFAQEIAAHYPLLVILAILGVPEADEPFLLRLTREYFGNADAELSRGQTARSGVEALATTRAVIEEATKYFSELAAERRRAPRDDLASVVANSSIDGVPVGDVDAMGYFVTVAFAGHDTTSSSVTGALWALAERPGELARVKRDLALVPSLVEEAVRWTTPIHQFVRRAACEAEVAGQRVARGERVALCFPSGNRDEAVFPDPFEFRADRAPNRHVGFGFGAHACLGVHLARIEMAILFEELLPRIESLELAGEPKRTVSNFVGGPRSLPVRIALRACGGLRPSG
jgi:cytochrome P450